MRAFSFWEWRRKKRYPSDRRHAELAKHLARSGCALCGRQCAHDPFELASGSSQEVPQHHSSLPIFLLALLFAYFH